MKQIKEIKQNRTSSNDFDIWICVTFARYFLKGDWALSSVSTQFWDFPNISWFPKILSLNRLASLKELVYKVCCTRYQVPLYLWSIKHILNYCIVSNNYLAAILVAHKLLYYFIVIQYAHENWKFLFCYFWQNKFC